jgi:hypothetical protein
LKQKIEKVRATAWRSSAAKRFIRLVEGVESVEDAIHCLTQKFLEGVECPPTDLESIGAKLGITGFELGDIAGAGELRKDGCGFRIVYASGLSPERRRFTIAHEMGHVLLEKTGPNAPRSGKELERLCNLFAVELLMPRDIFVQSVHGDFSTQQILNSAKRFRTSISSAALRFAELFGVSVFGCQDFRIIWGKGRYTSNRHRQIDEPFLPAIHKALETGVAAVDEFFLLPSTSLRRWRFECIPLRGGRTVLCLLQPMKRPEPYQGSNAAPL